MNRLLIRSALVMGFIWLGAVASHAQSPSKRSGSPGEIAAASRLLAQKYDVCRRQAKEKKLSFVRRRIFIHDCVRK
jgi:hypothetical protein